MYYSCIAISELLVTYITGLHCNRGPFFSLSIFFKIQRTFFTVCPFQNPKSTGYFHMHVHFLWCYLWLCLQHMFRTIIIIMHVHNWVLWFATSTSRYLDFFAAVPHINHPDISLLSHTRSGESYSNCTCSKGLIIQCSSYRLYLTWARHVRDGLTRSLYMHCVARLACGVHVWSHLRSVVQRGLPQWSLASLPNKDY